MEFYEKRIHRQSVFQGNLISLYKDEVELMDGTKTTRELVEHPGGGVVVAFTPEKKLILVKQYRYGPGKVLLELPAGKIDPGESPESTALRELEEETGYQAEELVPLTTSYPTPGYNNEWIHIFLAKNVTQGEQHLDSGEFLSVELVELSQAVEACMRGEITDSKTQVGILLYWTLQQQGRLP